MRKLGRLLLPFVVTFAVFYPFAIRGLDIHHDGTAFKPALDVANGQTLFSDTFTQYGPLTTWIQAVFINLFGPSIYSIKLATVLFYSMSAVILVEIWSMLLSRRLAWISLLIWISLAPFLAPNLVFLPWSSVYALFFQLLAAFLFFQALFFLDQEKNHRVSLAAFFSGVSCVLTFWCRQPIGIVLTLGLGGVAFLHLLTHFKSKSAWQFAGFFKLGALVTLGGVLAYFYFRGSLGFWIAQTIEWPAQWAKGTGGTTFGNVSGLLLRRRNETLWLLVALLLSRPLLIWLSKKSENTANIAAAAVGFALFWRCLKPFYQAGFFTLIPLFALVMTAGLLWKERKNIPWHLLAWLALTVSSWAQFYPMNDPRHVYWAITPGIGLFVYWLHRWLGSQRRWTWTLVSVWLLGNLVWLGPGTYQKLTRDYAVGNFASVKGLLLLPIQATALEPLFAAIRTAGKLTGPRPIVIEGPDAFYSTFTDRLENSNRIPQIWKNTGLHETHFDAQGMAFIQKNHPWIISESTTTHFTRPPGLEAYQNTVTISDPNQGWETTLWIFKD